MKMCHLFHNPCEESILNVNPLSLEKTDNWSVGDWKKDRKVRAGKSELKYVTVYKR